MKNARFESHACIGRRASLLILLVYLAAPGCLAQGLSVTSDDGSVTATWLRPQPQGNTLRDICFVDARHGWAVGDAGTIMHSTDGGAHWTIQASGVRTSLNSCSFADRDNGWVLGGSVFLRTTDAGKRWSPPDSIPLRGESDRVWCVHAVTPEIVLITTRLGGIFRSTDGGARWRAVHDVYEPGQMCFADARHGWVAGSNGRIAYTSDTGITWEERWVVSPGRSLHLFPSMLYFADSLRGWLRNQLDTYETYDGGVSWTVHPDSLNLIESMCMSTPLSGWRCGSGISRTTDRGSTWQPDGRYAQRHFTAISFIGPDSGWAAGYGGIMLRTTDGGAQWIGNQEEKTASFRAVCFPSADTGYAAGSGMFLTTDAGMHWQPLHPPLPDGAFIHDMSFTDAGHGHCVGNNGLVLSTADAGANWIDQSIEGAGHLLNVCFPDPLHGWIAELGGNVYRTLDGGTTWQLLDEPIHGDVGRIVFRDAANGYIACLNGTLYRTSDGGRSWMTTGFGHERQLFDAVLTDSSGVVLLSRDGMTPVVIRSMEEENAWTAARIPDAAEPQAICFDAPRHGWLLDRDGTVLTTEDGGANWTRLPATFGFRAEAIAAPSSTRAIAVGLNGTFIRIDVRR